MKAFEIIGYTHDGAMYHAECLPEGVTPESEETTPIFASDEISDDDTCDACLSHWISDSHAGKASEAAHAPAHVYMSGERPAYFTVSESLIDDALSSYLETLVWSEALHLPDGVNEIEIEGDTYRDGTSLDEIPGCDPSDMPEKFVAQRRDEIADFLESAQIELRRVIDDSEAESFGYNFCLSRNGHGAGFFSAAPIEDRDGNEANRALQRMARDAGEDCPSPWVDERTGKIRWE